MLSDLDYQFYHKWAVPLDRNDKTTGARGFPKCDVLVIGRGESQLYPLEERTDDDDIEG